MPKRKALSDQFAPKPIKAVRAPRRPSRFHEAELIKVLDRFKKVVQSNADNVAMADALGELRAHLAYVRSKWKLNPAQTSGAYEAVSHELDSSFQPKHNIARNVSVEEAMSRVQTEVRRLEAIARSMRDARLTRRNQS